MTNWILENWIYLTVALVVMVNFSIVAGIWAEALANHVANGYWFRPRSTKTESAEQCAAKYASGGAFGSSPGAELTVNGQPFFTTARSVALDAMILLDPRSKRCAIYLLTAVEALEDRRTANVDDSHVLVSRKDLSYWRDVWLVADGRDLVSKTEDVVTPFDHYLY